MLDSSFPIFETADKHLSKPSKGRAFWRSDMRTMLMFLTDILIIFAAAQLAWLIRFEFSLLAPDYTLVPVLAWFGWWILAIRADLYVLPERTTIWQGLRNVATIWVYVVLGVAAIAFATKSGQGFSRLWAGYWFLLGGVGLLTVRFLWNIAARRAGLAGHLYSRVAIVSSNDKCAADLIDLLQRQSANTIIVGVFGADAATDLKGIEQSTRTGHVRQLIDQCHGLDIDSVWLALDWDNVDEVDAVRASLSVLPCEIHAPILPVANVFPGREVGQHAGLPAVTLGRRPLSSSALILKRAEDLVLGSLLLLLLSPFLLVIAIMIKLDSPGPVFFRQERHGFANGTFKVFKFRSMYFKPPQDNEFRQATKSDPRVTRLGRIIRRTSIDELPQLLNVVKGDMSLVGPRPHPVALSDQVLNDVEAYLARHKVKPGITGWAQIHGLRGETDTLEKMTKRVEYDLWYVDHWSVWLDLRILIMTAPALLDKNAY
ncbi:undecaprenyl-phosphate glucose phosphotransferase [Kordiimonas aestuarii]|uniref:undecaprenyl-phosphate glucose phosphotransferase n=1 Tax=Kordiimonas aestuarii TaxID=1005925 RepID=UPI0021D36790|nr:undecaprenyl-phosphate glucose phosphotransferase [Kordiimonas aestuarii]